MCANTLTFLHWFIADIQPFHQPFGPCPRFFKTTNLFVASKFQHLSSCTLSTIPTNEIPFPMGQILIGWWNSGRSVGETIGYHHWHRLFERCKSSLWSARTNRIPRGHCAKHLWEHSGVKMVPETAKFNLRVCGCASFLSGRRNKSRILHKLC